jgi:uncharacterized protein YukE
LRDVGERSAVRARTGCGGPERSGRFGLAGKERRMSDLVMDYGLLNQAATDIQGLSPEINRVKNAVRAEGRAVVETVPGQSNENNPELGPGMTLYRELGAFYSKWSSDMSNAMDGLNKLAGYFKGVADSFMETDASQAAGMNESAMMSAVMRYPGLRRSVRRARTRRSTPFRRTSRTRSRSPAPAG